MRLVGKFPVYGIPLHQILAHTMFPVPHSNQPKTRIKGMNQELNNNNSK